MVEYTFVATKTSNCIMSDNGHTMLIAAGNNVTISGITMDALRPGHWVYHLLEQIATPDAKYEILAKLIKGFHGEVEALKFSWGPYNG
jgi:cytochrome b561